MCQLIFKPSGKKLDETILRNSYLNNPDGMGVSFVKDGTLVTHKGLFKFEEFYEFLKLHEELEMVIHFRKASPTMEVTAEMSHPFSFDSTQFVKAETGKTEFQFAVAHNGKLSWRNTKEKSDTACFIEDHLQPMLDQNPWCLDNKQCRIMLAHYVGGNNKIVVMRHEVETGDCKCYLINSDGGNGNTSSGHDAKAHWTADGIWFSNHSYRPPLPPKTHTVNDYRGSGGMGGLWDDDERAEKYEKIYAQSPFALPDEAGWYWDFKLDQWHNKTTGVTCPYLSSRPIRPQYMIMREAAEKGTGASGADAFPNKVIPMGGGKIEVPRDDDADPDPRSLPHLDKKEKRILRRMALDYVEAMLGRQKKEDRLTPSEALVMFRGDIRIMMDDMREMRDVDIDLNVIKLHDKGVDVVKVLTAEAQMN